MLKSLWERAKSLLARSSHGEGCGKIQKHADLKTTTASAVDVNANAAQYPYTTEHASDPYAGAQAATYSYSKDYDNFGSGPPPPSQSAPAPPDPHGPPVPSESSWSSFTDQATLAQFAPPGKSRVPSASVEGNITVPGSYLHNAFVVQSGSNEGDVWIADSSASCHMTHGGTRLYNLRPSTPGRETITIEDRRKLKVECVGNMDVISTAD